MRNFITNLTFRLTMYRLTRRMVWATRTTEVMSNDGIPITVTQGWNRLDPAEWGKH